MDMIEPLKFWQQKKITKLSEAIRRGAKLRPQCRGAFFANGGSCAFGAAYEAITGTTLKSGSSDGSPLLGIVPGYISVVRGMVLDMNDHKLMSREAIADKLEAMGY